jgi:hypothetical protein
LRAARAAAPARSRRTRRSERTLRRVHLAARVGSCTDASFSAVFRYPPLGFSRGPAGREVLPSSSSGGTPGVPDPSQVYSRIRVIAPHPSAAANRFSDISVRSGPHVVRA